MGAVPWPVLVTKGATVAPPNPTHQSGSSASTSAKAPSAMEAAAENASASGAGTRLDDGGGRRSGRIPISPRTDHLSAELTHFPFECCHSGFQGRGTGVFGHVLQHRRARERIKFAARRARETVG